MCNKNYVMNTNIVTPAVSEFRIHAMQHSAESNNFLLDSQKKIYFILLV
jgi:hypothetical protein